MQQILQTRTDVTIVVIKLKEDFLSISETQRKFQRFNAVSSTPVVFITMSYVMIALAVWALSLSQFLEVLTTLFCEKV